MDTLRYLSVGFDKDGISEWQDERPSVFVPRAQIVELELRRGLGERTWLQLVLGTASALIGAKVLVSLVSRVGPAWSGAGPLYGTRLFAVWCPFSYSGRTSSSPRCAPRIFFMSEGPEMRASWSSAEGLTSRLSQRRYIRHEIALGTQ